MSTSVSAARRSVTAATSPPVVYPLLASALAWGVLFAVLPPLHQDFPLADDWAFARGAFRFAHGQGIHYSNWGSMPQLGQWLWACPFVWLLGASHVSLRLATIVLSWLGLWAFYDLLRQEGAAPRIAAFATAVLAFNPLFFLLQGTFMTDVPALALALAALALYNRALRGGQPGWRLAGAAAVAVLAVITRQNTLTVVATAAMLLWRQPDLRRRPLPWLAVLLPGAMGLATHFWFQGRPDIITVEPRPLAPVSAVLCPFVVLIYGGLAALPLLVFQARIAFSKGFLLALALLTLAALYWRWHGAYISFDGLFPYGDGILSPWGAYSGELVVGERPLLLSWEFRWGLTLFACLAGAVLLVLIVRWARRLRSGTPLSPLMVFTLFQVLFLMILPEVWDRYLMVLLPGLFSLCLSMRPREAGPGGRLEWLSGLALLLVLGVVSVGLMHDWLAWNAARWALGQRALAHGVAPSDIEGGMEWNGWFASADAPPQRRSWHELFNRIPDRPAERKGLTLPTTHVWFPHITGRFALSFTPVPRTAVVDAEPYSLWMEPGQRRFFLLRLLPRPPASPASASPPAESVHR